MSGCRAQPRPCSHCLLVLGRPASVSVSGSVQDPLTPGSQGSGTSRLYLPSEKCTRHLSLVQLLVHLVPGQLGQARRSWSGGATQTHVTGSATSTWRGAARCVQENSGGFPGRWFPRKRDTLARQRGAPFIPECAPVLTFLLLHVH